jgi:hypothetical protein
MTEWNDITNAVGTALGGDRHGGRADLLACWDGTNETDHAQRCVLAHYLADTEDDLDAEVAWDELALSAFASIGDGDLSAVGITSTAALAPSLHLNLGDGYLRQGRVADAGREQAAGVAAADALGDDGYAAMIRAGLDRLRDRIAAR